MVIHMYVTPKIEFSFLLLVIFILSGCGGDSVPSSDRHPTSNQPTITQPPVTQPPVIQPIPSLKWSTPVETSASSVLVPTLWESFL